MVRQFGTALTIKLTVGYESKEGIHTESSVLFGKKNSFFLSLCQEARQGAVPFNPILKN